MSWADHVLLHVPGSFPQVGLQRNAVGRFLRTATGQVIMS